jgi:hypothetical protein
VEKKAETEAEEWKVISSPSKRWIKIEQIDAADLVVGILANLDQESPSERKCGITNLTSFTWSPGIRSPHRRGPITTGGA